MRLTNNLDSMLQLFVEPFLQLYDLEPGETLEFHEIKPVDQFPGLDVSLALVDGKAVMTIESEQPIVATRDGVVVPCGYA
jgi:hypothetical protein